MAENYTNYIDREECIGDSLVTINNNFANLDTATTLLSNTSHAWVKSKSSVLDEQASWYSIYKPQLMFATDWLANNTIKLTNTTNWTLANSTNINQTVSLVQKLSSDIQKNLAWYRLNSTLLTETYNVRAFEQTYKKSINVVSQPNDIGKNVLDVLHSDYSSLLGGYSNYLKGDFNTLAGGSTNNIEGSGNFIGSGISNKIKGDNSIILGGTLNIVTGVDNFLGGGVTSEIQGNYNVLNGGLMNKITANYAGILGGTNNHVNNNNSFIIGSNIATTAPNTTYVNNLNIANTPAIDNSTNQLLVRSSKGNVGVKIINGIEAVDSIYTWTKGNSAALLDLTLWVNANSSTFVSNNFVLDVSSSLYNSITSSNSSITNTKQNKWLETNFNSVTSTIQQHYSIFALASSSLTWFTQNSAELEINLNETRSRKKYTEIIEVDSSSYTKNIAHRLDTKDVIVTCYSISTGEDVLLSTRRYDSNNIVITLVNATTGTYKIVVVS